LYAYHTLILTLTMLEAFTRWTTDMYYI